MCDDDDNQMENIDLKREKLYKKQNKWKYLVSEAQ